MVLAFDVEWVYNRAESHLNPTFIHSPSNVVYQEAKS